MLHIVLPQPIGVDCQQNTFAITIVNSSVALPWNTMSKAEILNSELGHHLIMQKQASVDCTSGVTCTSESESGCGATYTASLPTNWQEFSTEDYATLLMHDSLNTGVDSFKRDWCLLNNFEQPSIASHPPVPIVDSVVDPVQLIRSSTILEFGIGTQEWYDISKEDLGNHATTNLPPLFRELSVNDKF